MSIEDRVAEIIERNRDYETVYSDIAAQEIVKAFRDEGWSPSRASGIEDKQ